MSAARDIVIKRHVDYCDRVCQALQTAIDDSAISQNEADEAVNHSGDDGLFNAWQDWKWEE